MIDASVARAAGDKKAKHPTSKACRDFLNAVLEICHRIVMTSELREEWDKHQSSFARKWRKTMLAKKKLKKKDIPRNKELWDVFAKLAATDKQCEEMFKDLHLLEAALNTDRTIISLDDNTARKFFSAGSDKFEEIKCIVWVNPDKLEETPIEWLENGAPAEDERMLGFWKKEHDV